MLSHLCLLWKFVLATASPIFVVEHIMLLRLCISKTTIAVGSVARFQTVSKPMYIEREQEEKLIQMLGLDLVFY